MYKTEPLFYDGSGWYCLNFNPYNCIITIEFHKSNEKELDSYVNLMGIIDKNVNIDLINDNLYIYFDNRRCIVEISTFHTKKCFCSKKYIRSVFKQLSTGNEIVSIRKLRKIVEKTGDDRWDLIADFLNL